MENKNKVIVIGAGPAGLIAAGTASEYGAEVILLDSNEKAGKKLYITGKGRCNISNYKQIPEFMENIVSNPKFMYSALSEFSPEKTYEFFENNGLNLKIERGDRVFPATDKASDVTKTLEQYALDYGVSIKYSEKVIAVCKTDNGFMVKTEKDKYFCDKIIISTGGKSYALTGSTGDGYRLAKIFGHNIIDLKPALVPILLNDNIKEVEGLSLKNVSLIAGKNNKKTKSLFGEMLFTGKGISGPIVLSMSSYINRENLAELELYIDFKPALDNETLENRILRELSENINKAIKNVILNLLPSSLVNIFLEKCGIDKDKKCNSITTEDRKNIIKFLKKFSLSINRLEDIDYAIITSGGINTKEINPKTMESKLIKGLFFAGEIIDVDALTGGYNIQLALSSGRLAGKNSSEG